jgi:hypothetical protein
LSAEKKGTPGKATEITTTENEAALNVDEGAKLTFYVLSNSCIIVWQESTLLSVIPYQ